MDVKKFIDLHVHIGPEVLPRRFIVSSLIKKQEGKVRGIALKNHFYPTMPLIKGGKKSELILIGSVTLNNYLGGLNADAIYASAQLSERPIIVWFPTINAENFLRRSTYEIPLEWVGKGFKSRLSKEVKGIRIIDNQGKLTKEAKKVLAAIKENNCILATGHVSWQEAQVLVREASKEGIKKIIVTHPIYQLIDMPVNVQKELAEYEGVFMEQNYAMYTIDNIAIGKIADQIKKIGAEKCILTSDMGQVKNPTPSEALEAFTELLKQQGISEKELRIMGEENPRKLLA